LPDPAGNALPVCYTVSMSTAPLAIPAVRVYNEPSEDGDDETLEQQMIIAVAILPSGSEQELDIATTVLHEGSGQAFEEAVQQWVDSVDWLATLARSLALPSVDIDFSGAVELALSE
jgi:hypothetical protein